MKFELFALKIKCEIWTFKSKNPVWNLNFRAQKNRVWFEFSRQKHSTVVFLFPYQKDFEKWVRKWRFLVPFFRVFSVSVETFVSHFLRKILRLRNWLQSLKTNSVDANKNKMIENSLNFRAKFRSWRYRDLIFNYVVQFEFSRRISKLSESASDFI